MKIKYAAPKIFSTVNAKGEFCINAATPTITKKVWKIIPLTSPAAKVMPLFAPSDKLFVSKYKMSGPGANVKSIDAVKKYAKVESSKIFLLQKVCQFFIGIINFTIAYKFFKEGVLL